MKKLALILAAAVRISMAGPALNSWVPGGINASLAHYCGWYLCPRHHANHGRLQGQRPHLQSYRHCHLLPYRREWRSQVLTW